MSVVRIHQTSTFVEMNADEKLGKSSARVRVKYNSSLTYCESVKIKSSIFVIRCIKRRGVASPLERIEQMPE